MKNNYDQLNIEYAVTNKVSSRTKYTAIFLILIFAFIPLAKLNDVLDYNYATSNKVYTCFIDWPNEPLQFKSFDGFK